METIVILLFEVRDRKVRPRYARRAPCVQRLSGHCHPWTDKHQHDAQLCRPVSNRQLRRLPGRRLTKKAVWTGLRGYVDSCSEHNEKLRVGWCFGSDGVHLQSRAVEKICWGTSYGDLVAHTRFASILPARCNFLNKCMAAPPARRSELIRPFSLKNVAPFR